MTAVTSPNTAARTTTFVSMALDRSLPADHDVVRGAERDVELGDRDELDDEEEQQRKRREPWARVAPAEDDPVPMPRKLPIRMMFVKKPM